MAHRNDRSQNATHTKACRAPIREVHVDERSIADVDVLLEAPYRRTGYSEDHIVNVLSHQQLADPARQVAEPAIVRHKGAKS